MRIRTVVWVITSMLLTACASTSHTPSSAPQASIQVFESSATPTARVLTRADGSGEQANLPLDHEETNTGTPAPNHDDAIRALPKVGQAAPDFMLHTLAGAALSLNQLRGKPVVINFWTSWCVACRDESPILEKSYQSHKDSGLQILGLNILSEDTPDAARAYVDKMKLTFPIPLDEQGSVAAAYHVPGLPVTFFIDAQGIIRNVIVGQMRAVDLAEGLSLIGVQ